MPNAGLMRSLVGALMRYELGSYFRRVVWTGAPPVLAPGRPVVAYVNHHHVYDGHLMWLVCRRLLDRPPTTWMAEWDRFPFFAAVGAQPFPAGDPRRRLATVRRTARRFRDAPRTVLVYFPEAKLHAPEGGLLPFAGDVFGRLGRLYATAQWWPVAIHVSYWGEKHPTAVLAGGAPTDAPPDDARARLEAVWRRLRATPPDAFDARRTLLEGRRGPEEALRLDPVATFFERYL